MTFGFRAFNRMKTVSPALREQFDGARAERRRRNLKILTITVGSFYMSYTLVDVFLLPDILLQSIMLRFCVILPMIFGLLMIIRSDMHIRRVEAATLIVVCIGNAIWCLILTSSQSPWVLHYFYAAVIFQMVTTIVVSPPLSMALAATFVCFVINYTGIWFLHDSSPTYVLHHLALYLPAVVLTLMATGRMEAEDFRFFLQSQRDEMLQAELAKRNAELDRLSNTDALTGLANRRGADEHMRAIAHEPLLRDKPFAVLLIDVDFFKRFNDNYGHQAGDECLQRVADRMRRELRSLDFLARHGGEEFTALLPDTDDAQAYLLAERIRRAVENASIPHEYRDDAVSGVTISIGIACSPKLVYGDVPELVRQADAALYEAKEAGRNRTGGCRKQTARSARLSKSQMH